MADLTEKHDIDCVFWIPTIYHKDIIIQTEKTEVFLPDNSDGQGKYRNYLVVKMYPENGAPGMITVSLLLELKEGTDLAIPPKAIAKQAHIDLKLVGSSRNGMLHYGYTKRTDVDTELNNLIDLILPLGVYHLIKSFFHTHEFHSGEADSGLEAYVRPYDKNLNVRTKDNPALMHYLSQFQNRLRTCRRQIRQNVKALENLPPEFIFYKNREGYELIDKKCSDAIGESLYYKALLYSWYNDSFKIKSGSENNSTLTEAQIEECKKKHQCAVNIEGAIEGIKLIQLRNKTLLKVQNAINTEKMLNALKDSIENVRVLGEHVVTLQDGIQESLEQSDKLAKQSVSLGKLGKYLGIAGAVIGVISFGLSLYFNQVSSRETNEIRHEIGILKQKTDELKDKLIFVWENNTLQQKTDTASIQN
jgi:hypothetical protein